MPARIELSDFITPTLVEESYRQARLAQEQQRQGFADTGWRMALARDPQLLKALEKGAEITDQMTDAQHGRTIRDPSSAFAYTKGTTEQQLWRNAYKICDEGCPTRHYEWIYGAAAWLCGYNR